MSVCARCGRRIWPWQKRKMTRLIDGPNLRTGVYLAHSNEFYWKRR